MSDDANNRGPRAPTEGSPLEWIARQNDYQIQQLGALDKKVDSLRVEVAATYARESDCAGRSERERNDRADGAKRVWDKFAEVDRRLDGQSGKVRLLEGDRREDTGAHKVIKAQTKWALGIVTALIIAGGSVLVTLLAKGCTGP